MKTHMLNRTVSVILILFLAFLTSFGTIPEHASDSYAENLTGHVKEGTTQLRVRDAAGGNVLKDAAGNIIYLNGGHPLTILDRTNSAWYKVSFSYNGIGITGYISSSYIVIDEAPSGETGTPVTPPSDDTDFEAKLSAQNFPDSYKPYLRELHKLHPNWEFTAVHTGIDWNTLIENERNKSGQIKNLINCTSSAPHYNWRATVVGYNWATDTWSPYDGKAWFAASQGIVEYYLDPRTYLYQNYIFTFESLSYQEGIQNIQGVEAILKGSFMYNTVPSGETKKYSELIMEAAAKYKVSPYHLASRMKQEMGNIAGTAALGNSSTYPGIFNYFNIGAFDSASGNAVTNGLKFAATSGSYGRPWNTVAKSISGGAQYLGESYINKGQDTIYTQKFNVTNKSSLFSHQYMTNVQVAATEANSMYKAYVANGIIDSTMLFKIPVYTNMPAAAVPKPADSGNPNNWLKSLSVSGYSLTPSFAVNGTTEYSLIVPENVGQVSITAAPVNANAKISGTGSINLNKGTNTVKITVTAQNGNGKTYTLTIVRQGDAGNTGSTGTGNTGGTGSTVKRGDLNKDGNISAIDIVKLQRIIVGLDSLNEELLSAGDLNNDGKITAIDIVKIQRHIVGIELIQ